MENYPITISKAKQLYHFEQGEYAHSGIRNFADFSSLNTLYYVQTPDLSTYRDEYHTELPKLIHRTQLKVMTSKAY